MNSISELFIKECIKTESPITPELIGRLTDNRTIRLLHGAMGLITEGAELLDALKKYIFYGKDLDLVNIAEELGDNDWYEALILDEIGKTHNEIWAAVIKKLQARYKGKFNEESATNRNLENERAILEDNFLNSEGGFSRTEQDRLAKFGKNFGVGNKVNNLPELFENNERILHELTENVVNSVKMEIVDDIIHYRAFDDHPLCNSFDDSKALSEDYSKINCSNCKAILNNQVE